MYSQLENIKNKLGFNYVLDGMIMDDLDDFRPGLKARTTLVFVAFYKKQNYINLKLENKSST